MADPLEEIEFLARSANRIEVLRTLTEAEYTRRELGYAVDASQPTIGRVLNDLRDRNWITYDGERYRATATGELVADGITGLRDRLATETRLREIIEYLPTDVIDVGLQSFHDATITTPTGTRPNAPIHRMLELLEAADEALLLSHTFNRQKLDCIHDRTIDGTLTTRGVFATEAIQNISEDATLRNRLIEIVATDTAAIRVAAEKVPVALEVTDDRTHLLLRDNEGMVRASMDTANEDIRAWATTLHEHYWEQATPVEPGDLRVS